MSKILGPLFVNDKRKKDETTVTASNPRDSTEPQDPNDYLNLFDSEEFAPYEPQDPDDYFDFFGYAESDEECDDDAVFAEAYPDIPDNDESDAFNFEECDDDTVVTEAYPDIPDNAESDTFCFDESDADSIEPDHDDFWDTPSDVQVKPSIKETYKDAIYTDKTGKEKINKIKFVDIYINDNSLIIAQDTTSNNDAQLIHIYANGKYTHYSDIDVKRDITRIINELNKQLLSVGEVNDILTRIKWQASKIDIDDFDSDENIINFLNGLVDIRTGKLMPHSSNVFSTIQIPCNYSPATFEELKKYAPVFVSYLRTLTNSNKDVATLILQYLAVILSNINGTRFKKALILHGEGDTGKSKIIELIQFLIGSNNYTVCDIADLEKRFHTSLLHQKRLAGTADMSFSIISELKNFKSATGGDQLFGEQKGKDGFHFQYKGLFLFGANRLPIFGGDKGSWVYDRFIIVNCENVIPKDQQDHRLVDKMKAEKDVIASYLVCLLPEIIKNDYQFQIPPECDLSLEEFRINNSPVLQFYTQFCEEREFEETPTDKISGMMLFNAFSEWEKATHSSTYMSYKNFTDEIASYLHIPRKDFFLRKNDCRYIKITVQKEYINDDGEIHLHY